MQLSHSLYEQVQLMSQLAGLSATFLGELEAILEFPHPLAMKSNPHILQTNVIASPIANPKGAKPLALVPIKSRHLSSL